MGRHVYSVRIAVGTIQRVFRDMGCQRPRRNEERPARSQILPEEKDVALDLSRDGLVAVGLFHRKIALKEIN